MSKLCILFDRASDSDERYYKMQSFRYKTPSSASTTARARKLRLDLKGRRRDRYDQQPEPENLNFLCECPLATAARPVAKEGCGAKAIGRGGGPANTTWTRNSN